MDCRQGNVVATRNLDPVSRSREFRVDPSFRSLRCGSYTRTGAVMTRAIRTFIARSAHESLASAGGSLVEMRPSGRWMPPRRSTPWSDGYLLAPCSS